MTNFEYPIYDDRLYTLDYGDGLTYQVSGEAIINAFRREALIHDWIKDGDIDDIYYNSDLGEL
jgi:hypothetical protein